MRWVREQSEAVRKRLLIEKQRRRPQTAVKADEGWMDISRAAENVRLAAFSLMKAKRSLIKEYPYKDPNEQQSRRLQEEEQRWLSLSTKAIKEVNLVKGIRLDLSPADHKRLAKAANENGRTTSSHSRMALFDRHRADKGVRL